MAALGSADTCWLVSAQVNRSCPELVDRCWLVSSRADTCYQAQQGDMCCREAPPADRFYPELAQ